MKKLVITLLGSLLSFCAFAQYEDLPTTKVDWNGVKLEENIVIGVSFVVDKATFGGLSYEDRCEVDPELVTEFQDAVARCVNAANNKLEEYVYNIYFGTKTEGKPYTLTFNVRSVSTNGHVIADAVLVTPTGTAIFTNLHGNGGVYGSFVNLMGDGFESLGKDIAKRIIKAKGRKKI